MYWVILSLNRDHKETMWCYFLKRSCDYITYISCIQLAMVSFWISHRFQVVNFFSVQIDKMFCKTKVINSSFSQCVKDINYN